LTEGSSEHRINHAVIKNSTVGVFADALQAEGTGPGLRIENTEIYNTSGYGLFARSSSVYGSNLVVGNNGSASLACTAGGSYRWIHSTFANYWSNGVRNFPAVVVSNAEGGGSMQALFENSVIEGNQGIEFLLEKSSGSDFSFGFSHSLLRFDDPGGFFSGDPLYDFTDDQLYRSNNFNGNPDFSNIELNDFRIKSESEAIGLGDPVVAQEVPVDLLGENRRNSPDSGAYQHLDPEE
jgi:hypothetical protein